jgi:hypothetical protein
MREINKELNRAAKATRPPFALISFFYVFLAYLSGTFIPLASNMPGAVKLDPLWPIFWTGNFDPKMIMFTFALASTVFSIFAAFCPHNRIARVSAFMAFFELVALLNSFGEIAHKFHLLTLAGGLLIFLPKSVRSYEGRKKFYIIFWGCQAIILLSYTMSGILKIAGAIVQIFSNQHSMLSSDAVSLHIANFLVLTGIEPIAARFFIEHNLLTSLMFFIILYLQVFSFFAIVRPSIQRIWGICLVLFHIGTLIIMHINFLPAIPAIAIFLVNSPFAKDNARAISDLPIIGRLLEKGRRAIGKRPQK